VDTTGNLTSGEQSGDGLAVGTEDTGLGIDLKTTHGVVKDRGHEGDVEDVVHLPLAWLEEFFAEWALLSLNDVIVILEGLFELRRADTNVLGESSTVLIALHEAAANVVLAVPLNLLGSFTIEDESDWVLNAGWSIDSEGTMRYRTDLAPLFPDLPGDVVTVLQLIDESLTLTVEQETANTAEGLGSKELDLCSWFVGVDQTCRVHLNLLHVDSTGTNGDGDLVSVAGTVITVGGGEFPVLWAIFLQQGVRGEVGGITAGGQDDGTIGGLRFSTKGVLNTDDGSTILDELGDTSFLLDDDAFGVANREVLEAFHLSICNNLCRRPASVTGATQRNKDMGSVAHHSGKLSIATVGSRLTVTTKSGNLGKVELELVL